MAATQAGAVFALRRAERLRIFCADVFSRCSFHARRGVAGHAYIITFFCSASNALAALSAPSVRLVRLDARINQQNRFGRQAKTNKAAYLLNSKGAMA